VGLEVKDFEVFQKKAGETQMESACRKKEGDREVNFQSDCTKQSEVEKSLIELPNGNTSFLCVFKNSD